MYGIYEIPNASDYKRLKQENPQFVRQKEQGCFVAACLTSISDPKSKEKVLSVGIDLADLSPFRGHEQEGAHTALYHLLYTEAERTECKSGEDPAAGFAMCFAAKEAVVKALGSINIRAVVPQVEVTKSGVHLLSRRNERIPPLPDNIQAIVLHQSIISQTGMEAAICLAAMVTNTLVSLE